ncbi:MAG TPA: hypothetical protein VFU49_02600 [Ktedonobacteraceae bacterium]|nr:hypothetical protein [Ktedonobacteraceae bacterium]
MWDERMAYQSRIAGHDHTTPREQARGPRRLTSPSPCPYRIRPPLQIPFMFFW